MTTDADRMPQDIKSLLIVLPTWVGDFVMATPTLCALRERFADARITFLAVPNLVGLIQPGDWADDIVTWPAKSQKGSPFALWRLGRQLRRHAFDLAILLPNSFRSALAVRLSGAKRRVGYDRDGRGWLLTDRLAVPRVDGQVVPHPICDYYSRLAETLGCPPPGDELRLFTDSADEATVEQRLNDLARNAASPLVAFCPGASFGASKLWLPERFAEVGDRLARDHDATVVITCGPGEESMARNIAERMSATATVFENPGLTLGQLKALLRRCDLVLCTDSGPRHIAKAFGVPIVSLFGPTHQAWTDTEYPKERKIQIEVDCGPCQKKLCPLGHLDCMTGITVDRVMENCEELLRLRSAATAS